MNTKLFKAEWLLGWLWQGQRKERERSESCLYQQITLCFNLFPSHPAHTHTHTHTHTCTHSSPYCTAVLPFYHCQCCAFEFPLHMQETRKKTTFWKRKGTSPERRQAHRQIKRRAESGSTGCRKWNAKQSSWGEILKKSFRMMQFAVCMCVCVCVCVSSAVLSGVNLGVDGSGKTLETACRVVLLFWASA